MGSLGRSFAMILSLLMVISSLSLIIVKPAYAQTGTPHPADSTWSVQTVDTNGFDLGDPNVFPIALDSNNVPHIAYTDILNATDFSPPEQAFPLMYASWTGSQWNTQQVSPKGYADSLAFDSHNNPHIVFSNNGLMYASWNGSNWNIQTVDPHGNYGSLALDSAGNPHIAYTDGNELEYASWTGANWTIQTVATSQIQFKVSLSLDSANTPYIAYLASGVKLAVYSDSRWSIQTVASNVTGFGNIVVDSTGHPRLIYAVNSILMYDSWNGTAWNSQNVTSTLDTGELGGGGGELTSASLALDSHGYPHIAYVNSSSVETLTVGNTGWGYLAYASWTGDSWVTQAANSNLNVASCDLVLDSKGNPNVSLIGIDPESTAAEEQLYGPYTWTASVLYATATEPTPTSTPTPSVPEFPSLLIIVPLLLSLLSVAVIVRHRKTANLKQ